MGNTGHAETWGHGVLRSQAIPPVPARRRSAALPLCFCRRGLFEAGEIDFGLDGNKEALGDSRESSVYEDNDHT